MSDFLKPENCNKVKCKSCPFNYNEHSVKLSKERLEEIICYLTRFESSHICHTTNKTCYGGLELQANQLFKIGIIKKPDVETMLEAASKHLM